MIRAPGPWEVGPDHEPVPPPTPDDGPSSAATPPRPGTGIIRPMPTAGDGPSFEALAMQSVLTRARDDSRFAAPTPAPDNAGPRRKLPVRTLLLIAVGVLVLGVVGGTVWVTFFRDVPIDAETIIKVPEDEAEEIRSPQEAVLGYFEALADGDIEAALTYGPPPASEHSHVLLTSEAYSAMPPDARPSDISILTDDPLATEVDVTYMIAGEKVSRPIRVTRLASDSYELERTTVAIQLEMVSGDNLPVFVNGVPVGHRVPLEVVPGTYSPSTGLPFVEFPTTSSITIRSLAHTDVTGHQITPALNEQGRTAFLEAAKSSLERCMSSTELAPEGCPNSIQAPEEVVPGSVKWELQNKNVWASAVPKLSSRDQTVAVATIAMELRVTMDYTLGRDSGPRQWPQNVAVSATMLGGDASSITVRWDG